MSRLEWDERFDTGIAPIDEQHRELLETINEIDAKLVQLGRFLSGRKEMLEIIGRLAHYAEEHFTEEEAIMAQCAYPDLDAHRQEHRHFRELIQRLERQYADGASKVPEMTLEFLTSWLLNHIQTRDQEMAACYRG